MTLTSMPMATKSGGNPNINTQVENYHVDVVWTWPTIDGTWSRLRLVRKARSPAVRVEEGRRIMETDAGASWNQYLSDGRPWYRDESPVPDEWNFYSAFVLNNHRIWVLVGTMADVGIGDHGWTTRLPEFMPGAAVASDRGTMHPGDQGNVLVNFMQPMGVFMDRVVSMAEGARMFLDPRRCAPRMIQFLADTYGYRYAGTLTLSRVREIAYSVRRPDQGMMSSIQRFSEAATGCQTTAFLSDNLFLNVNDSSFEQGTTNKYACGWHDIADVEVIAYQSGDVGLMPPNVHRKFYAKISGGKTIKCGMAIDYTQAAAAGSPYRVWDPIRAGIPMQTWREARMSVYASRSAAVAAPILLRMGIEMYDLNGALITSQKLYESATVGTNGAAVWKWYGNEDNALTTGNESVIPLVIPALQIVQADRLTSAAAWKYGTYLYATEIGPVSATANKVSIPWSTAPAIDLPQAFCGIPSPVATPVHPGAAYTVSVTVESLAASPAWRPAIMNKAHGDTVPQGAATVTSSFDWVADDSSCSVGIEVIRPPAGWTGVALSKVTDITMTRKTAQPAYAVPWLYVDKDCYVDLIVVDDGR